LDWWLIGIILAVAFGILLVCCFVGCNIISAYRKKLKSEEQARKMIEDQLKYEQDGIHGFFKAANIRDSKIQLNPLHMSEIPDVKIKDSTPTVQMIILNDDDDEFYTTLSPGWLAQTEIDREGGGHMGCSGTTIANSHVLNVNVGGAAVSPSVGLYMSDSEVEGRPTTTKRAVEIVL